METDKNVYYVPIVCQAYGWVPVKISDFTKPAGKAHGFNRGMRGDNWL